MEQQTVGVIGLGLMGASLCKALGAAGHRILGRDADNGVEQYALLTRTMEERLTEENVGDCDALFLAVYPGAAVDALTAWAPLIRKETVVMDLCGVKRVVCGPCFRLAAEYGFAFVGGHPMAGRQYSGIKYATEDLYRGSAVILVPKEGEDPFVLGRLRELLKDAGVASVTLTTAEKHDRMIAFSSQLTHVVSNAFIKSPTARERQSYFGGSYRDLTRVARLNETMWTELFLDNADYLEKELDGILAALGEYRDALKARDEATLERLLKEGRERKEEIDRAWNA